MPLFARLSSYWCADPLPHALQHRLRPSLARSPPRLSGIVEVTCERVPAHPSSREICRIDSPSWYHLCLITYSRSIPSIPLSGPVRCSATPNYRPEGCLPGVGQFLSGKWLTF